MYFLTILTSIAFAVDIALIPLLKALAVLFLAVGLLAIAMSDFQGVFKECFLYVVKGKCFFV
jgi:hypothetical protein